MASTNGIIGSVLSVLNDTSKLADPIAGRNGSFFFGPNQQLEFRYNAPKGKVTGGVTFSDDFSFGSPKRRSKHYNIHVGFFTPTGFVGSGNIFKNEELVNDYMERIEQTIMNNMRSIGHVTLESVEIEEEPFFIEEQNVYGARQLFVFEDRK